MLLHWVTCSDGGLIDTDYHNHPTIVRDKRLLLSATALGLRATWEKKAVSPTASALLSASALCLRATEEKAVSPSASALLSASALGLRTTFGGRVVTISDHTPPK